MGELRMVDDPEFVKAFRGSFVGILRWPQLDDLWSVLEADADGGWYIYAVGETPPSNVSDGAQLKSFLKEIDILLRKEHDEDYCGVVYVDDRQSPSFVKIFDPNNLGVSCGFSENPPLPGWILCKIQPVDLPNALPQTGSRRRWWQRLFS
jgi:hypothetical protein